MSTELWGTFAVKDHLVPRAFVADVLLYDRLVIPTKPKELPDEQWPRRWDLARQKAVLGILGPLAIDVAWDQVKRDQWQKRFDDLNRAARARARAEAAAAVQDDGKGIYDVDGEKQRGYQLTRMFIEDYVGGPAADDEKIRRIRATRKAKPGATLEVVAAYTNYDDFAADVRVSSGSPEGREGARRAAEDGRMRMAPTTLFGWRFLVPDSDEHGDAADLRLLEKAVAFAQLGDTIAARDEFYKWLHDVTENGLPPDEARADMEQRIAEFHNLVRANFGRTATRYGVKVLDMASHHLIPEGLLNTATEFLTGSADILADEKLRRAQAPPRLKVAALFHDARARFGWRPPDSL
jgi:hypothetical protein